MTTQQLRYFVTCAALHSFKRSAGILYTNPSTITRQIAALEDELGIKLFVRDTHKTYITNEGNVFYLRALSALSVIEEFTNMLVDNGKISQKNMPGFLISVYTRDGMFGKIVGAIEEAYPSENINKPYKFYYPEPGDMIESVLEGVCQVGVETRDLLSKYEEQVGMQLLHHSPYRIIVGKEAPLYGRTAIGAEELLREYKTYGDFLPLELGFLSIRDKPLSGPLDLLELGSFTVSHLPEIFPYLGSLETPPKCMLLVPGNISFTYSQEISSVRIKDKNVATDYMLFWKKQESDPDLKIFLKLMARYTGNK
ncbi:MAG: LysR family transcriptional regulator [Lachnospiraceae bacterium]|jgi:hypothetical protein|nr:LysR family transcriptional regulator [Lachnospiraceae bacterium]